MSDRSVVLLRVVFLGLCACVAAAADEVVPVAAKSPGGTAKDSPLPLAPVLEMAKRAMTEMEQNLHDYSAVLVKRQRVDDKLSDQQSLFVKIRETPFSVYAHYLEPADRKGIEAVYVEGKNEGKLQVHTTGLTGKLLGTMSLAPDSSLITQEERHPVTEIGITNIARRLRDFAQQHLQERNCAVQILPGAKVNGRPTTCVRLVRPSPDRPGGLYLVRIFFDDELHVPIRYEAYDWTGGDEPEARLLEEYTYVRLKVNVGFTDADFDPKNPKYGYP